MRSSNTPRLAPAAAKTTGGWPGFPLGPLVEVEEEGGDLVLVWPE